MIPIKVEEGKRDGAGFLELLSLSYVIWPIKTTNWKRDGVVSDTAGNQCPTSLPKKLELKVILTSIGLMSVESKLL